MLNKILKSHRTIHFGIIFIISISIFGITWAISNSYQSSFSLTDGNINAQVSTQSDWTNGYCRNIDINNTSQKTFSWSLSFDLNAPITNGWNGIFTQSNIQHSVTPDTWGINISPGGKYSFGFCADTVNRDMNWIITSTTVANLPIINGNCGADNGKTL